MITAEGVMDDPLLLAIEASTMTPSTCEAGLKCKALGNATEHFEKTPMIPMHRLVLSWITKMSNTLCVPVQRKTQVTRYLSIRKQDAIMSSAAISLSDSKRQILRAVSATCQTIVKRHLKIAERRVDGFMVKIWLTNRLAQLNLMCSHPFCIVMYQDMLMHQDIIVYRLVRICIH